MKQRRTAGRLLAVIGLGGLLLLVHGAQVAGADTGVGISASPVVVTEPIRRGDTEAASPVLVVNTGTDAGTFALRVAPETGSTARAVPAEWVRFEVDELELGPGERRAVAVSIAVPAGAEPADYQSLIYASAASSGGPGGNRLGVEAATRLGFTVSTAAPVTHRPSLASPAALGAAALAALVLAGWALVQFRTKETWS